MFELTEEQELLRAQVRGLLEDHAGPARLRELITEGAGMDRGLWDQFAGLGLLGAAIPEEYGGVGLGPAELCLLCEEIGRATAPVPFFSSICLAAEAICLMGSEAQKARWLPALASGEAIGAFALDEKPGPVSAASLSLRLEDGRLNGIKRPVADAGLADILVVALADESFALVETAQEGVIIEPLKGFDELRHHAAVRFEGARGSLLGGAPVPGGLDRLRDRAAIYQAFEQVGGCETALHMARDYALQRYIFGRQLASYQAIKHRLADILVSLELARSNALAAGSALEGGQESLGLLAAAARLSASEAYEVAARENLQVHGGIGFTWEANCHFHYRRARLLGLNLGSRTVWADRLIEAAGAHTGPDQGDMT